MKVSSRITCTLSIAVVLSAGLSARADVTSYSTNFDSMSTGSIFGQEGWASLNSDPSHSAMYVQEVTTAAQWDPIVASLECLQRRLRLHHRSPGICTGRRNQHRLRWNAAYHEVSEQFPVSFRFHHR